MCIAHKATSAAILRAASLIALLVLFFGGSFLFAEGPLLSHDGAAFGDQGSTITVGLDTEHSRPFPSNFYGANGQDRNSFNWDDPAFQQALRGIDLKTLRLPAGTGANYWDWQSGTFLTNYADGYNAASNLYPSPLSELATELFVAHATPLFVLNMLTDPTCVPPAGGTCAFTPSSPNLDYQLQLLQTAQEDHIDLRYLELGNEYFLLPSEQPAYSLVYPNPTTSSEPLASVLYGRLATQWISAIKQRYPDVKIAAVGEFTTPNGPRGKNWIPGLFDPANNSASVGGNGQAALQGADAVTIHAYGGSNLPPGSVVTPTTAEDMLGQPFKTWNTLENNDLPAIPSNTSIWFTEYNLKDQTSPTFGTWAHGLYMATMSLLMLEDNRTQLAIRHDVVGGAIYGDLFSSTTAFQVAKPWVSPTPAPPTTLYGKSATADAMGLLGTAADGADHAQRLIFANVPMITDSGNTITYPALYGWNFTRRGSSRLVILNLDNQPLNVDLGQLANRGFYDQISGDPGTYITGGLEGSPSNLTERSGRLTGMGALSLPAFSITRIDLEPGFLWSRWQWGERSLGTGEHGR